MQFTYDVTEPGVPYPTQSYELSDFDPTYTVRHGCSTAWVIDQRQKRPFFQLFSLPSTSVQSSDA